TFSHLERSAEAAALSPPARDALLGRSLTLAVGGLACVALVGAAAVFLFFPRVNAQWLGRHRGSSQSVVGYAGQVALDGSGTLRSDPRPALRVRFPELDADHLPAALLEDGRHLDVLWRGSSLDHFDGRAWRGSGSRA